MYIYIKSPLSRVMGWGEKERGDVITQIKPEDRKYVGHENKLSTST